MTRFFYLNRCSSIPVPTRISHNRHQDRKRSCTKHLSRFTPLLMFLVQWLRRHHLRDLETLSYPHAVPFKKSGSCLCTAQLVPGSARGRTQLKLKKSIQLCTERDGAPIQEYKFPEYRHSDLIALEMTHCSIAGRRTCSLVSALVRRRAAPVPSSFMPWPGISPG